MTSPYHDYVVNFHVTLIMTAFVVRIIDCERICHNVKVNEDWLTLFDAATQARASAYCPYSGYQVGAAILANNGRVYSGANVENRSFGATICAERHAIGAMIADGGTAIVRILVVTSDAVAPCGMCLQVIAEFGMSQTPIAKSFASGELTETTLGALLPHRFESDEVPRKY